MEEISIYEKLLALSYSGGRRNYEKDQDARIGTVEKLEILKHLIAIQNRGTEEQAATSLSLYRYSVKKNLRNATVEPSCRTTAQMSVSLV